MTNLPCFAAEYIAWSGRTVLCLAHAAREDAAEIASILEYRHGKTPIIREFSSFADWASANEVKSLHPFHGC